VAVPGERFRISLKVDGVNNPLIDPVEAISAIAEAELDMRVEHDGTPVIVRCVVSGEDYSGVQFRNFKAAYKDSRLAGSTLSLKFYLRDKIARQLKQVLQFSDVNDVLERYQGIRIYRDGINVPPYGLNGNDWAALEKQRTSTGGPTMVPGNSQLIGELRVPPSKHLSITAGRSGFSDQEAVAGLAAYVRWSVKELGTARRAEILGIHAGVVPSRVDGEGNKTEVNQEKLARRALADLARDEIVTRAPELRQRIERVRTDIESVFDKNEGTLRLYAQLASTGIAATSFAHELRTDFDVVSAAVKEIVKKRLIKDDELKSLLVGSWARIKNFVALFRLLPVKTRRNKSEMRQKDLQASVNGVFKLVPEDTVHVGSAVQDIRIVVVPAELDSILLNLVSNSVKAIAESRQNKNGKIRVEISGRGADAVISVFDNGCGVPEQLKAVMFEPLEGRFSEGTGMGLAIVSYIAQRYKGSVVVADAPAGGYVTQIRVTLKGVLG
jgi:signal transduction histidine kinase